MLNAVKHPGWHSGMLRYVQHDTQPSYLRPCVLGLCLLALLAACGGSAETATSSAGQQTEMVIFAAASLKDGFERIAAEFEAANPGVTVLYNFAGSQQLAQQLAAGAPADVFASANLRQMQVAVDGERVADAAPRIFARNRLAVIHPQENPANLETLHDLARPGVKLVLAATTVPVGQYSLEFLAKATASAGFTPTYSQTVLANVVSYEENVRGVLTKVALGEADAGIVYTSDAAGAGQVEVIEIPDALNVIAEYPIAVIQDSKQAELAQKFVALVLSEAGQAILSRVGFLPITQESH
jgi:molybdate transport system substrate-binding protein